MSNTTTRMAGVLMPVASLPSKDGIGSFGKQAYRFVNLLAEMGFKVWQILPLNPLGYGNSPYQPFSSYAGDELYIDLDELAAIGLLKKDRKPYNASSTPGRIDYQQAKLYKETYLKEAYENFRIQSVSDTRFEEFQKMDWVYLYAVFIALKKQNGLRCWNEWPKEQRDWILNRKYDISHLEDEIGYQIFVQYMFYVQWMDLKSYANKKDIYIMGDIPFYVGIDSLDVWGSRENFLLDDQWNPSVVAGVPPDYFSATGQRWGNPIYNWDTLQKKNFSFWIDRLNYCSTLYDIIRIDHFRAFDTYWQIPASCATAVDGEWLEAPGYALFDELYRQSPDIWIVAEDLGDLRPEVLTLRDHYHLMGMNVVEFSISSSDEPKEHQLIYTGTHDNQTVRGWLHSLSPQSYKKVRLKLAPYGKHGESLVRKMMRYVLRSECRIAIIPLTDILELDDNARINTPGKVGSPNWEWHLADWNRLNKQKPLIQEMVKESNR